MSPVLQLTTELVSDLCESTIGDGHCDWDEKAMSYLDYHCSRVGYFALVLNSSFTRVRSEHTEKTVPQLRDNLLSIRHKEESYRRPGRQLRDSYVFILYKEGSYRRTWRQLRDSLLSTQLKEGSDMRTERQPSDIFVTTPHKQGSDRRTRRQLRHSHVSIRHKERSGRRTRRQLRHSHVSTLHKQGSGRRTRRQLRHSHVSIRHRERSGRRTRRQLRNSHVSIGHKEGPDRRTERQLRHSHVSIRHKEGSDRRTERQLRNSHVSTLHKEGSDRRTERQLRHSHVSTLHKDGSDRTEQFNVQLHLMHVLLQEDNECLLENTGVQEETVPHKATFPAENTDTDQDSQNSRGVMDEGNSVILLIVYDSLLHARASFIRQQGPMTKPWTSSRLGQCCSSRNDEARHLLSTRTDKGTQGNLPDMKDKATQVTLPKETEVTLTHTEDGNQMCEPTPEGNLPPGCSEDGKHNEPTTGMESVGFADEQRNIPDRLWAMNVDEGIHDDHSVLMKALDKTDTTHPSSRDTDCKLPVSEHTPYKRLAVNENKDQTATIWDLTKQAFENSTRDETYPRLFTSEETEGEMKEAFLQKSPESTKPQINIKSDTNGKHDGEDAALSRYYNASGVTPQFREWVVSMMRTPQREGVHHQPQPADFHSEWRRLATFDQFQGPPDLFILPLANNGFFLLDDAQEDSRTTQGARRRVECAFCGVRVPILRFQEGRRVEEVHRQVSPHCRFVSGGGSRSGDNVAIADSAPRVELPSLDTTLPSPSSSSSYVSGSEVPTSGLPPPSVAPLSQQQPEVLQTDDCSEPTGPTLTAAAAAAASFGRLPAFPLVPAGSQKSRTDEATPKFDWATPTASTTATSRATSSATSANTSAPTTSASIATSTPATVSYTIATSSTGSSIPSAVSTTSTPANSSATSASTATAASVSASFSSSDAASLPSASAATSRAAASTGGHQRSRDGQSAAQWTAGPSETENLPVSSEPATVARTEGRGSGNRDTAAPARTPDASSSSSSPSSRSGGESGERGDRSGGGVGNEEGSSTTENGQERQVVTYEDLGIFAQRPKRPDMAVTQLRINTFTGWPHEQTHPAGKMAEAGFYYTGYQDLVRCFYCKGGLKTWERSDQPWVEHCRWFPRCPFVRLAQGQRFVDVVQRLNSASNQPTISEVQVKREVSLMNETDRRNPVSQSSAALLAEEGAEESVDPYQEVLTRQGLRADVDLAEDQLQDLQEQLGEEREDIRNVTLCKMCQTAEVNVLFLPCGHLVACAQCAPALRTCAMCRQPVKGSVRVRMADDDDMDGGLDARAEGADAGEATDASRGS